MKSPQISHCIVAYYFKTISSAIQIFFFCSNAPILAGAKQSPKLVKWCCKGIDFVLHVQVNLR